MSRLRADDTPSRWLAILLAALVLTGCEPMAEAPAGRSMPRHLILITVDTWRGDHFLSERAGTPVTPRLAHFAENAIYFPDASSVAAETTPGVAGIMTGLIPGRSGVLTNPHVVQSSLGYL